MLRIRTALCTLSTIALAGCGTADRASAASTEQASDTMVNAQATDDQPAIGVMDSGLGTSCTATLIASKVILMAAHCFKFDDTRSGLGNEGSPPTYDVPWHGAFTVKNPSQSPDQFTTAIGRFAMLSKQLGDFDVAVAELRDDVPPTYATPLNVHLGGDPIDGEPLRIYGFGCTSKTWDRSKRAWVEGPGFGTKRYVDAPYDRYASTVPGNSTCPGDSGGPSTVDMLAQAWGRADWIYDLAVVYGRLGRPQYPT